MLTSFKMLFQILFRWRKSCVIVRKSKFHFSRFCSHIWELQIMSLINRCESNSVAHMWDTDFSVRNIKTRTLRLWQIEVFDRIRWALSDLFRSFLSWIVSDKVPLSAVKTQFAADEKFSENCKIPHERKHDFSADNGTLAETMQLEKLL